MKTAHLASAVTPIRMESADLLRLRGHERPPMLTLASLSRGLSVIALSGCAVVVLALRGPGPAPREAAAPPAVQVARPAPAAVQEPAPAARLVYGNPDAARGSGRQAVAPAAEAPAVEAPAVEAPPALAAAAPAEPLPVAAALAFAPEVATPLPAATTTPADAVGAVDLNSASVEQLNGLNAGMIGRAIVKGRPYGAPEDLLGRRILSRASFDKIKGRIAVAAPN